MFRCLASALFIATLAATSSVGDAQYCYIPGYRFYQGQRFPGTSYRSKCGSLGSGANACSKGPLNYICDVVDIRGCTRQLDSYNPPVTAYGWASWMGYYSKVSKDLSPPSFACIIPGYIFYPGKDSPNGNLSTQLDKPLGELADLCSKNSSCAGFSTIGFLKNESMWPQTQWTAAATADAWEGLYVKDTAIPGYKFNQGKDSFQDRDTVLRQLPKDLTPRELAANCTADPACKGFNTLGYLKKVLSRIDKWPSNETTPQPWDGVYVRDDALAGPDLPGYRFFQGRESLGDSLVSPAPGLTPQQLAELCNYDADCKAFNTNGTLKSAVQRTKLWVSGWTQPQRWQGMYVKDTVTLDYTPAPPPSPPPPSPPVTRTGKWGGSSYEDDQGGDSSYSLQSSSRYEDDKGEDSSYSLQSSSSYEDDQGDDSNGYNPKRSRYEGDRGYDSSYSFQSSSRYEDEQRDDSSSYNPRSSRFDEDHREGDSSSYNPHSSSYEERQADDGSSDIPHSSSYQESQADDSSGDIPHSSSYDEDQWVGDGSSYTPTSSSFESHPGEADASPSHQQYYQVEGNQDSYLPVRRGYDSGDDYEDDDRRRRLRLADGHRKLKLSGEVATRQTGGRDALAAY